MALGNASDRAGEVAVAIAGFAVGLPGYALVLFLTRVCYAYDDVRTPTLVNGVVTVVGAVAMAGLVSVGPAGDRIAMIGVGFGAAQWLGAALLALVVRSRVHAEGWRVAGVTVPAVRAVLATAVAAVPVWAAAEALDPDRVGPSLLAVALGGAAVGVVVAAVVWATGGPRPLVLVRSLGGDPGRWPPGARVAPEVQA
jgi:putative peptidoglycan lipid II flippase